jgi:hypothetical protein
VCCDRAAAKPWLPRCAKTKRERANPGAKQPRQDRRAQDRHLSGQRQGGQAPARAKGKNSENAQRHPQRKSAQAQTSSGATNWMIDSFWAHKQPTSPQACAQHGGRVGADMQAQARHTRYRHACAFLGCARSCQIVLGSPGRRRISHRDLYDTRVPTTSKGKQETRTKRQGPPKETKNSNTTVGPRRGIEADEEKESRQQQ